jgi:hypothetical protein
MVAAGPIPNFKYGVTPLRSAFLPGPLQKWIRGGKETRKEVVGHRGVNDAVVPVRYERRIERRLARAEYFRQLLRHPAGGAEEFALRSRTKISERILVSPFQLQSTRGKHRG